jgi:hypothetical protein
MRPTLILGRLLALSALCAVALAVSAAPAGAQAVPVVVDLSASGTGPVTRDAFIAQGLLLDREGYASPVAGDDALGGPIGGAFTGSVDALAVRVAPSIPTGFSARITAELTLVARDASGDPVASVAEVITVAPDAGEGTGYVTLDLGPLPRPASGFAVEARVISSNVSFCPTCFFFAVSELRFSLTRSEVDTFAPWLTVPERPVRVNARSSAGARVPYAVRATDDRDARVTPSCAPRSGRTFAIGRSTVRCTARDAAGNVSTAAFTVEVVVVGPRPPDLGRDHVVGFGDIAGGAQRIRVFAEATSTPGRAWGTLSGTGVYTFAARATCIRVEGKRATVGAQLTSGADRLGRGLVVHYEDAGDGGAPDRIIGFEFSPAPPASCPRPRETASFTIDGDLDVHDARPLPPPPATGVPHATG